MSEDAPLPQLEMRFEDAEALEEEIEAHLRHGRAFVPGASGPGEREACELVLHHPESGDVLSLAAEVVWVQAEGPGAGIGLELAGAEGTAEAIEAFLAAKDATPGETRADSVHARVRHYTAPEQLRCAREGELAERVVLEQIYGKAVWELLLRNPRITLPEVTRISRNPKIPKHLIELIAGNAGWLANGTLRRSLLKNAQLTGAPLDKVLRATPKAELATIFRQPGFPPGVREAIKKLLHR